MSDAVQFLTPVGRLVQGSLYKGSDKDAEGNPLRIKTGPNAGQPRVDFFFALAIPKGAEQHWAHTEWGKIIWEVGTKSWPQGQFNHPSFAWKITDGDSAIPNKRGRKPCDREGYRGHWVVALSSGYPPRIYSQDGSQAITEPDAVKIGYYVQVSGTVASNGSSQQPGVFINHSMVALAGYGPEIMVGPDPTAVGFGQATLPAGASATPIGGMKAGPAATPPVSPPVTLVGVQPDPQFLSPPPPAPPVHRMLPAASGSYEQYLAAGWSDAQLVQHGLMA